MLIYALFLTNAYVSYNVRGQTDKGSVKSIPSGQKSATHIPLRLLFFPSQSLLLFRKDERPDEFDGLTREHGRG